MSLFSDLSLGFYYKIQPKKDFILSTNYNTNSSITKRLIEVCFKQNRFRIYADNKQLLTVTLALHLPDIKYIRVHASTTSDLYLVADQYLENVTLFFQNKALSRNPISLLDYNIFSNNEIDCQVFPLLGGCHLAKRIILGSDRLSDNFMRFYTATYTSDLYQLVDIVLKDYTLYFNGKPLSRRCVLLDDYNIKDNSIILIKEYCLYGGGWSFNTTIITKYFNNKKDFDWTADLVESLLLLVQDLYQSVNGTTPRVGVSMAMLRFIKMRTSKSIFLTLYNTEFSPMLDDLDFFNDQSFQDKLDNFKDFLSKFESLKESKIMENVRKLVSFAITFSLFEKLNVPLYFMGYTKIEAEMLKQRRSKSQNLDFVHSVLSSLHYLTEKGYQYYMSGNLSAIFHSSRDYTRLIDSISELRRQSKFLTNPEPHGFTESKYRSDLDDSIEKLTSVIRFNSTLNKFEKNKLREMLNELKMMRFDLTTIKASREHRKAPFSVLIYGDSGIGKTTLKDILFYYYADLFGLENDKTFCYSRNPAAKYWDNFVSSCWCVILDDVAFRHPNLGEDPSCMEFLQINNSVPFVPDQAALDKKGTTPLRAELVIGTTNSKNLNAHFYFSCASAAQRRFPYIITPTVKEEYRDSNGMLDSTKSDQVEGAYPDFWNFKVERVKSLPAISSNMGKPATFELIDNFKDINSFLAWYGSAAKKFSDNQKLVENSVNMLSKVQICKGCFNPKNNCTCTMRDQGLVTAFAQMFCYNFLNVVFNMIITNTIYYLLFLSYGGLSGILSRITQDFCPQLMSKAVKQILVRTGERMQRKLGKNKDLILIAGGISSCLIAYKTTSWIWNKLNPSVKGDSQSDLDIGCKPKPKEKERDNVWWNAEMELDEFNLTPQITSSKSLSREQIIAKIGKNCYIMQVANKRLNYRKTFRIICLKGNLFIMNDHSHRSFTLEDEVHIMSAHNNGVTRNIQVKLTESSTFRNKAKDICFIQILNMNPGADITGFISTNSSIVKQNGFYIHRMEDGSLETTLVKNSENVTYKGDDFTAWSYKIIVEKPTVNGHCGSPLILSTPMGYVLAGFHVGGDGNIAAAIVLTKLDIDIEKKFLPIVQQGEPLLSAPSQNRILGPLHEKSVVRFIEDGVAECYGSFTGFRREPKSTVERTPIFNDMVELGYSCTYTKPMMRGWQPFRIAALDMVNPVFDFDPDILEECSKNFLDSILGKLSAKDLSELHVYDLHTAVNGAPGVAYVDRLKSKTSAGNPWKCKKTKFLIPISDTDDFEITVEISDRVAHIIGVYRQGTRYHPVFCANLKDEAVSELKAKIGKTRVFSGAPMDWSIVVRMFYLAIIRLIQNNKFIFEAGVGTVAQSREWTCILDYLMRSDSRVTPYEKEFLIKRFIAGDYKAFDKRMSPLFILRAFWILIEICIRSGNYTQLDVCVLWGIAYDIAFPLMDFNGDLMQFFGSNPSGHPLTVIINSIVNSLYVRYAYYTLHPKRTLSDFGDNVRLITYGDDNVMTSTVNWFNHTAMSESLAKIGVTYTMADKEAVSRPFIHLNEVSFLKRSWEWNHELKCYLAPLDHDSISKMLMVWTRSKISEENQIMDTIKSAVSEYFFYGKKVYETKVKMLRAVVHKRGWDDLIVPSTFPTWKNMKQRFISSTFKLGLSVDDDSELYCDSDDDDYVFIDNELSLPLQNLSTLYHCGCMQLSCKDNTDVDYYMPLYLLENSFLNYIIITNLCLFIYMYYCVISSIISSDLDLNKVIFLITYFIFTCLCNGNFGGMFIYFVIYKILK